MKPPEASRPEPKGDGRKSAERKRPESRADASRSIFPGAWQANAFGCLLFFVATLILYSSDLHLGFFSVDDPDYVVKNPWIRSASARNLGHILGAPYFANYSPVHLLSYTLDYAIAGPSARAFHFSSNVWAGLVAGFVFLVALALTRSRPVAAAAAALFVLHPAHVEAVAWISSRKDLVAAAFVLPSFLAYLRYRRGGRKAIFWYGASLLLFLCAVSGKLSVATFPAILFGFDFFVERRALLASVRDKLPFVVVAGMVAILAASAQPSMGHHPNPFVLAFSLLQNIWLLFGFGSYVIYRVAPDGSAAGMGVQLAATTVLIGAFLAPLLLGRRWPLGVALIYWILLALIPPQVLSFTHPVADRYLFFPSAGAVILIACGIVALAKRLGRYGTAGATTVLIIVALFWAWGTLGYLAEWRDPRSVWYAGSRKSADPAVQQALGAAYLDAASGLGASPRGKPLPETEARSLATVVWAGDPRLPTLLAEWEGGHRGGPVEKVFQGHLRTLAWEAFDAAVREKHTRVMPALYYNRGLILLDQEDFKRARQEFQAALEEASHETFAEVRQQITVYSQTDLGVIALKTGDYREALHWFQMAEAEQTRAGGNWVPDLPATRQRLEGIVAKLPDH